MPSTGSTKDHIFAVVSSHISSISLVRHYADLGAQFTPCMVVLFGIMSLRRSRALLAMSPSTKNQILFAVTVMPPCLPTKRYLLLAKCDIIGRFRLASDWAVN